MKVIYNAMSLGTDCRTAGTLRNLNKPDDKRKVRIEGPFDWLLNVTGSFNNLHKFFNGSLEKMIKEKKYDRYDVDNGDGTKSIACDISSHPIIRYCHEDLDDDSIREKVLKRIKALHSCIECNKDIELPQYQTYFFMSLDRTYESYKSRKFKNLKKNLTEELSFCNSNGIDPEHIFLYSKYGMKEYIPEGYKYFDIDLSPWLNEYDDNAEKLKEKLLELGYCFGGIND